MAAVVEKDVYRVVVDASFLEDKQARARLAELQAGSVFLHAKLPVEGVNAVRFVEQVGFHLIDTNVVFEKTIESSPPTGGQCTLRWAVAEDGPAVVDLARRSFEYSRFHLDPRISRALADRVKAEWVRSFFAGRRGQRMALAVIDEAVVGFLLLLASESRSDPQALACANVHGQDPTLTIDLIATDTRCRRRGVARDMMAFVQSQCDRPGRIRVGTQLANIPSIQLYERAGFNLAEALYVFHYHNG